jgi:hypothetical protein
MVQVKFDKKTVMFEIHEESIETFPAIVLDRVPSEEELRQSINRYVLGGFQDRANKKIRIESVDSLRVATSSPANRWSRGWPPVGHK